MRDSIVDVALIIISSALTSIAVSLLFTNYHLGMIARSLNELEKKGK